MILENKFSINDYNYLLSWISKSIILIWILLKILIIDEMKEVYEYILESILK